MIKLKNIFFALLFIQHFLTSNSLAITDSLIGTIGSKALTSSDLINEMKMLLIVNGKTFSQTNKKELQSIALRSIINRLIKQIEIEKHNFNDFNKEDIVNEINSIAKNLNMDVSSLKNSFKVNKINFSNLENRIETELKWNGLIFTLYKNRITININEINRQLKLIQNQKFIEEYLIYEILIEPVSQDKFQAKINEIKNKIQEDGFEKTAIIYSKAESASNGGKLGWVKETALSEKFRKVLKNINVGSIAKPVAVSEGIILLKLADKKKLEQKIDLEVAKNALLNSEKEKKLQMYALSHYNKLKQSVEINLKFQ